MIVWLSRDDVRGLRRIAHDVEEIREEAELARVEVVACRAALERIATAVEQPPRRVPTRIEFRAGTPVQEE